MRAWLGSDDLQVLSATFDLLENKAGFSRVEPPLAPQEKRILLMRYFERALPRAENALAKVQSGWDENEDFDEREWLFNVSHALTNWGADFLRDEATPESEREIILIWVRDLVLHRPAISSLTTAVLDHLVWNRATRRFFKSWPKDSELAFLFSS